MVDGKPVRAKHSTWSGHEGTRFPRTVDEIRQFMFDAMRLNDRDFNEKWAVSYHEVVPPRAHSMIVTLHDELVGLREALETIRNLDASRVNSAPDIAADALRLTH